MIPSLPVMTDVAHVVFTAVYGDRDALGPPGPLPAGWHAVAFTSGADHPGWTVVRHDPGLGNPVRNAKAFKLLPHRVFPDARFSLWMDASFTLGCDPGGLIETYLAAHDLALHAHPERDCVYDELDACLRSRRDDPRTMLAQVAGYARAGHPAHAGLAAGGVILRRHCAPVHTLNEAWWHEVATGSHRDQLSFDVVARRLHVGYARFASHLWHGPLFRYWRPA